MPALASWRSSQHFSAQQDPVFGVVAISGEYALVNGVAVRRTRSLPQALFVPRQRRYMAYPECLLCYLTNMYLNAARVLELLASVPRNCRAVLSVQAHGA
jgi:hypothetical protein